MLSGVKRLIEVVNILKDHVINRKKIHFGHFYYYYLVYVQ